MKEDENLKTEIFFLTQPLQSNRNGNFRNEIKTFNFICLLLLDCV